MIEIDGTQLQVRGSLVKIARVDGEKFRFADNPDAIVDSLRESKHRVDIFTFIQKVSETSPKYSYPMEWDNLAVLPISTFDHWWNRQIGTKTRNMARQVEKKGAVIREVPFSDSLVRGIWEIYNETPIRGGRKFPHFGKDLETVYREEATYIDQSTFIGAFVDDKLIGFIKLIYSVEGSQAGLLNIVSLIEHRDKAPTNALIARAVQICAERNIPFLVYSNFAYGKRNRDSLSDFKERNAFQRVNLPRYYVPLTPVGHMALRLGVHKKISERIPERMVIKLRQVRKICYGRLFQLAPEKS
ncbi:MAG TPA: hypothetical protein VK638_38255 [Edaphobacter sp.]|nr:hypothetical protein [Edaphobacter sp.]